MNRILCLALLGLCLAVLPLDNACACNGRGGNQRGNSSFGRGQVLNGYGSYANDMRMQQQMQQAYLIQEQALAMQKAQQAEARHAKRLANAEKHRAEAAAQREAALQKRNASNK